MGYLIYQVNLLEAPSNICTFKVPKGWRGEEVSFWKERPIFHNNPGHSILGIFSFYFYLFIFVILRSG